jgi:hypothetical protein
MVLFLGGGFKGQENLTWVEYKLSIVDSPTSSMWIFGLQQFASLPHSSTQSIARVVRIKNSDTDVPFSQLRRHMLFQVLELQQSSRLYLTHLPSGRKL